MKTKEIPCFECETGIYRDIFKDYVYNGKHGFTLTIENVLHHVCDQCGDCCIDEYYANYIDDCVDAKRNNIDTFYAKLKLLIATNFKSIDKHPRKYTIPAINTHFSHEIFGMYHDSFKSEISVKYSDALEYIKYFLSKYCEQIKAYENTQTGYSSSPKFSSPKPSATRPNTQTGYSSSPKLAHLGQLEDMPLAA